MLRSSSLEKLTFEVLKPYINIFDCGQELPKFDPIKNQIVLKPDGSILRCPQHIITDKMREENNKRAIAMNIMRPGFIRKMIQGSDKFYYTGGTSGKTMVMLDIDAHRGQTDQDFTHECLAKIFPEILSILSGRGINDFLKLNYGGERWTINKTLNRLEEVTSKYLWSCGCQCDFEIKGTLTTRDKSGSLAKLPCTNKWTLKTLATFEQLPEVTTKYLLEKMQLMEDIISRAIDIHECRLDDSDYDYTSEFQTTSNNFKLVKKASKLVGSCTGFLLSQDQLENVPDMIEDYKTYANHCYAFHEKPKRNKIVVKDFAYGLVVLSICARHQNKDGSTPNARIRSIWHWLYTEGYFDRDFNESRWAAIRNTLTDLNYLDIIDLSYYHFNGVEKGKAMKWNLKEQYCCSFESNKEEDEVRESIFEVASKPLPPVVHDYVPERARPEEIFPSSIFQDQLFEEKFAELIQMA